MSAQATGDVPQARGTAATERCGQCGAPAAPEQRYCLSCGFHRRNAPDPVARYLSEASVARARVAAAMVLASQRRRAPRIGARLSTIIVVLALLIGILIGNATAGSSTPRGSAAGRGGGRTHTSAGTHTTKVKKATGSGYLQQEQSLPTSVTP